MVIGMGLEDGNYMGFLNDQRKHDDGPIDPIYKVFLEHLKADGKSYVFQMVNGDRGLPVRVKYEEQDGLSEIMELDTQATPHFNSSEGKGNSTPKSCRKSLCWKSDELAELSPVPHNQSETPPVDDDYMRFLSHVKANNGSMILEYDSVTITYEEDAEAQTSNDSLVTDEQGLVPYTTSQIVDLTVHEDEDNRSLDYCESNEFKRKLMVINKKPYDQKEYEGLWKEISERKPLERMKHLRNMSISYATKEDGNSYLDHYPELAQQILATDDCHKRLILLRGFFFWLKNLCHEGAYMPWISSGYETITLCDYEIIPPLKIARD
ncbi:uncharacterized protein M6B38_201870 [Iris pallida]|uniref:Uncharacterized protein n=1 Tax=Iris pallida TaxID=29817 RepID=A0AAX6E9Z6_IRIPA|nr:Uncharacterized protein M6B38_211710 [Iris pallida]KAJ6800763.1 uncharacterized protein M6B38_201870 [Iris pallida]